MDGDLGEAREIDTATAYVIREDLSVRAEFDAQFKRNQSEEARMYSSHFSSLLWSICFATNPPVSNALQNSISSSAAALTGELFQGRPLVRTRVKRVGRGRNNDGYDCSKYYRIAASHTPGLFTVQCVCIHPKILGITVIQRDESLSMAITVLFFRFEVFQISSFRTTHII